MNSIDKSQFPKIFVPNILRNFNLLSLAVVLSAMSLFVSCSDSGYEIVDTFADSTDRGKFVFMFVKVKSYDENRLYDICAELKEHPDLSMSDKTKMLSFMVHFYTEEEIKALPQELKAELGKKYEKKMLDKLDFVKAGRMFISFSKDIGDIGQPVDSLFTSSFVVPGPGISAKEISKMSKR